MMTNLKTTAATPSTTPASPATTPAPAAVPTFGFMASAAAEKIKEDEEKWALRVKEYAFAETILRKEAERVGAHLCEDFLRRGIKSSEAWEIFEEVEENFNRLKEIFEAEGLEEYIRTVIHPVRLIAAGLTNGTVQDRTDPDLPKFEKYLRDFSNSSIEALASIEDKVVRRATIRTLTLIALRADYISTETALLRLKNLKSNV